MNAIATEQDAAPVEGPGDDLKALLEKLVALLGAGGPPGADVSRNQEAAQLTGEDPAAPMPPKANPTMGAPAGPMDKLHALMAQLKGGAAQ
jgi:hypothetical protein